MKSLITSILYLIKTTIFYSVVYMLVVYSGWSFTGRWIAQIALLIAYWVSLIYNVVRE